MRTLSETVRLPAGWRLSTRDIEATFRGEDGRSLLSRTAVSEVTEQLWEEYEAFAMRDLLPGTMTTASAR